MLDLQIMIFNGRNDSETIELNYNLICFYNHYRL